VYLSRFPWRALLLLWRLRIFAAAAARTDPTPPPFSWGREVPKKIKSPVASEMALVHVCFIVGVVEVAVQCKHYTGENCLE
jgi:hypothetical protein